jgi:3-phenylpropionate/trans-cinnamate dioxygenase ferredoxin component
LADVVVAPLAELPPGSMKIVIAGTLEIGVYNCGGELLALEDRCSHDDGPLCEGVWEEERCVVVCPRHGSEFDLRSGVPLTLPAYVRVPTFAVRVEDGIVIVEIPEIA